MTIKGYVLDALQKFLNKLKADYIEPLQYKTQTMTRTDDGNDLNTVRFSNTTVETPEGWIKSGKAELANGEARVVVECSNRRGHLVATPGSGRFGLYDTTNERNNGQGNWVLRSDVNGNVVIPHPLTAEGDFYAGNTGITGGESARVHVITQNVHGGFIASNQTQRIGIWDYNYNNGDGCWYVYGNNGITYAQNPDKSLRPVVGCSPGDINQVSYFSSWATNGLGVYAKWGTSSWATKSISIAGSDARLKENVSLATKSGLSLINSLSVKQFDWKDTHVHWDYGIIAQEVREIDPNLVIGEEKEDSYLSIDTLYLADALVKAVQELTFEVEKLKAEVDALKN